MTLDLIFSFLIISLAANIVLILLVLRKKPVDKSEMTYDARALLRDLASGPALIKIEYVDRADVFLRSPRDRA